MQCRNCKKIINKNATMCIYCNYKVIKSKVPEGNDKDVGMAGVVLFLFPLIGLILSIVWLKLFPVRAKSAFLWSIAGFVFQIMGVLGVRFLGF